MYFALFCVWVGVFVCGGGGLCLSLFCYELLCVISSFAIIFKRKRELDAFLCCLADVCYFE